MTITTDIRVNVVGKINIYSTADGIVVEGLKTGERVSVYNLNGLQLQTFLSTTNRILIPAKKNCIYLVKAATKSVKVIL